MDNTAMVAFISLGDSVLIAITALVLKYRGFASLEIDVALLKDMAGQ
jgi:hypothetical protein